MSGKNRKQKKSINLLQFKGGSWVTENEMQWTHQRLIANHNGHRWDHRKSQRTHSPKLETFSLTHLLSLLQNLKNQNQQEKKSIPNFKTSEGESDNTRITTRRRKHQTAESAIPRRQNNNFYPPRRRQRNLGRELTQLSKRGLRFGRDLDRFNGLGVKREWMVSGGDVSMEGKRVI